MLSRRDSHSWLSPPQTPLPASRGAKLETALLSPGVVKTELISSPEVCSSRFQSNQGRCRWLRSSAAAHPLSKERGHFQPGPHLSSFRCVHSQATLPHPRGPLSPDLLGLHAPETPLFPSSFPPGGFVLRRWVRRARARALVWERSAPWREAAGRTGGAACRADPDLGRTLLGAED